MIFENIFLLICMLALDAIFGDPNYPFHPIRLIGNLSTLLEGKLRLLFFPKRASGIVLLITMLFSVLWIWVLIHELLNDVHPYFGWSWQLFTGWSLLACRDLIEHARCVWNAVINEDIKKCREKTSKVVGRDTARMDFSASGRAVVESISENLNDGVIAPLFYFTLLGIPGMLFYKVINTLDSMVGYRNETYQEFGWASAKLDDLVNWLPARFTWLLISLAAWLHPYCFGFKAFSIGLSEHNGVSSPNAGWCEAAVAGALKIRLCGPIWRDGQLTSEYWLGSPDFREGGTVEDMKRAVHLALIASAFFSLFSGLLLYQGLLPLVWVG